MKWIKISDRQPEDWEEVVIRRISNRLKIITDITTVHKDADAILITAGKHSTEEIPFEDLEWLDESPSPSTPILGAELKEIEGFTAGPWKVCIGNRGSIFGDLNNRAHDGDNPYIGTVAGISVYENIPECNANAELIAYAPELYQMAGELMDECERIKGLLKKQFDFGLRGWGNDQQREDVWQQFKTDNNL